MKKISVIIPAHNEEITIGLIIFKLFDVSPDFEIIVIDDGSTDNTAMAAANAGAIVFSHPYNIGNGAAIKTGIRKASGDILVFMDADNQHAPKDIENLLKFIPGFDMVVGARRNKRGQANLFRWIGNSIFNRLASYVAKFSVQDLTSGFRVVKADIAKNMAYMLPNSYSYPTTMTLSMLRSGFSVKYVPIDVGKRKKGKSKIRVFQDGVRFFMIIVKICTLFSPMRVFLPVSFFLFLLGFARYIYTFWAYGTFTNMSALLFIAAIIIFMMGLISEQICQMRYDRSDGMNEKIC
jgi:glycosyltransferase involved in cell wall biosynthesis